MAGGKSQYEVVDELVGNGLQVLTSMESRNNLGEPSRNDSDVVAAILDRIAGRR